MNEAIQQARVDLAAALRLAERFGLHEGICNHFSYALPGRDDRFLLNPYGTHWSQVTASGLQLVDGAGQVLDGDGEAEVSAFSIHAPIHQRHRRARAVLHTHMPYATSLTSLEDGRLEPVTQNALRFHGDVAYDDDYNGVAEDTAEGERMAGVLGDNRVLFLAHHGVIVVGETIAQAFDDLYYHFAALTNYKYLPLIFWNLRILDDRSWQGQICRNNDMYGIEQDYDGGPK